MALVLAAWIMAGLAAADAEGQHEPEIFGFLAHGALAGAVSGICGGLTLRRLNPTTPWHQVLLSMIIGFLAGALLWLIIAELYNAVTHGGLRRGSGGLGLIVGIAIIGCIYGVAKRSLVKG